MPENKKLITVAQAAEVLGRSKSAIYAALNGTPPRLQYHDPAKRLILRDGLEARFARSTRPRIDKPQAKPSEAITATSDEMSAIAVKCNQLLDFSLWGPPPWTELQWVTLRNVIELAEDSSYCSDTNGSQGSF